MLGVSRSLFSFTEQIFLFTELAWRDILIFGRVNGCSTSFPANKIVYIQKT